MPTFLLLLAVLAGRIVAAIARGVMYVLLMPARTALAVAPHMVRPRWLVLGGALASLALAVALVMLLAGQR